MPNNFKENWLKIMNYNANVEILKESDAIKEKVRIPLTSITTNGNILYYLFELLYPKFINDQQNILDLVINDDGTEILKIILYETKKAGIHESFKVLPNNIIRFQENELDDIDTLFNKIQSTLVEKRNVRISNLRLFKKNAIDLINKHCINIENISNYEFLRNLMDLIQTLFKNNLFYIYPEPNVYRFLNKSVKLLNGINLAKIFQFIEEILPDFNTSTVFYSDKLVLILQIIKKISKSAKSEITIKLLTPEDLGIEMGNLTIEEYLNLIKEKLKSERIYFMNQNNIFSLLLELFEMEMPPTNVNLGIVLQKVLFGFRSFENYWYTIPRPKIYDSVKRFISKLFGKNLNLKKVSHWSIPELIFNWFDRNLGLNSKFLVILTDVKKYNLKKDYLNNAFNNALLFEIENRRLTKIRSINKEDILFNNEINTLDKIRSRLSEKCGFISAVISIDKLILTDVFGNFGFKLHKFKPLSKTKAYKILKSKYYFNVYPDLPLYKLIKDNGLISLIKLLIPILIDKHEF